MPPQEPPRLYTRDEVAKLLRVEPRTLARLIEAGQFPRPQQSSPGVRVWSEDDLTYYRLWMALRHRLRPAKPKGQQKTPKDNRKPPQDK